MKDHLRDYCTEAFRFYARNGKSSDKYKNEIYQKALEEYERKMEIKRTNGYCTPTESAIMAAENAVDNKLAEIMDMEAVEMTLVELKCTCKSYIVRVVEHVYFKDPDKKLSKGDIQARIHVAELEIHASERSVYGYLRKAREVFALKRGLRK